jgi:hypothetical protein
MKRLQNLCEKIQKSGVFANSFLVNVFEFLDAARPRIRQINNLFHKPFKFKFQTRKLVVAVAYLSRWFDRVVLKILNDSG